MSEAAKTFVGQGIDRVDGKLKVTGAAKYTSDLPTIARPAHARLAGSRITRGRITAIDTAKARRVRGVIDIFTHESGIRLASPTPENSGGGMSGNGKWMPLQDAEVHWNGQPIALVLAETPDAALQAAALIDATYSESAPNVDLLKPGLTMTEPKEFFKRPLQFKKGDPDAALAAAGKRALRETYETPVEHHNPMELHATTASWSGDSLTVYDSTQNVGGTRGLLAATLGIPAGKIQVISHFLGGGFGCKGFYWPHTSLAAAVARKIHRPVKLELTRSQMFEMVGHRSRTVQEVALAAAKDGKLTAVRHQAITQSSQVSEFVEPCVAATMMLYETPNLQVIQKLAKVDTGTPCPTRAPGEASGSFALECAMDELAYRLELDPVELRLRNLAERSPEDGKLFSSKHLKECYLQGRDAFHWSRRRTRPGKMRDGRWLVGYGMATATYPANRSPASARATILADGTAHVVSAAHDIGTGAYTILTQVAADELGLPIEKVRFELGDTAFPKAPGAGGSQTSASVAPAVQAACRDARQKLRALTGGSTDPVADILKRQGLNGVTGEASLPDSTRSGAKPVAGGPDLEKFTFHSFGAHFVECRVDPELGVVRLARMLGIYDIGRVLNPKTARSQALGGMAWGVGMALMEETYYDPNTGRIATSNLADYRVPVNADIPPTDVIFLDIPDPEIGPIGMRGLGEIPITGVAAAIANAIYHATGKRIRSLPITPDKLI